MRGISLLATAVVMLAVAGPPAAAQVPGPAVRETWRLATMGDSYASGEGAPDAPGSYDAAGHGDFSQREDWDVSVPEFVPGPPGQPAQAHQPGLDTERCHRSPASPSGVAVAYLRESFPDVDFPWTSVACSGASVVQGGDFAEPNPTNLGGLLRPYKGAEALPDFPTAPQPPILPSQIDQLNQLLPDRPLDALIVNAGGNDAGFGSYIVECGKLPGNRTGDGDCHRTAGLEGFLNDRLALLRGTATNRGRYDRLAAALRGSALANTGDPQLLGQRPPRRVFVTALPDVVRKSETDFCHREPAGQPEQELTSAESRWLEETVKRQLNDAIADAAGEHDWTLSDAHVKDFRGHAICQADNWINRNHQALPRQGDDVPAARDVPFADFAQGWVHPNHVGYERIGHRLADPLVTELTDRLTPKKGPRVLASPIAGGARLRVDDSALPPLASPYYHQYEVFRRLDDGTLQVEPDSAARGLLPRGTTSVELVRDPAARYLVQTRACGPLARDASAGCGPPTPTRLSLIAPARPGQVEGGGARDVIGRYFFTVRWRHASAASAEDTSSARVRIRAVGARVARTFTVAGNVTSFSTASLSPSEEYVVSVAACNDAVGCSGFTPPERISAAVPLREDRPRRVLLPDPARVDIAGVRPRCDRTPRPLTGAPAGRSLAPRPGLGPVVVKDENRTFTPPCILDPPVGEPSVSVSRNPRVGRTFNLTVRWRHPRAARELSSLGVRVRSPSGVLGTLTFDENVREFSFAAGARGRSAGFAAGEKRTLRAGALELLVDRGSARVVRSRREVELHLRGKLGGALARRPLLIEVAGSGDDATSQSFVGRASLRAR